MCFNCGVYGHSSDYCPHKSNTSFDHLIEVMNLAPSKQVTIPQDPYGHWISRFNPIYNDNAYVNAHANQSEAILDSSHVDVNNPVLILALQNHIPKVLRGKENSSRKSNLLKVRRKSLMTLRKNLVIPRGSKSSNVVVSHHLGHRPSSSNRSQGNHVPPLNPLKHSAVEISATIPPSKVHTDPPQGISQFDQASWTKLHHSSDSPIDDISIMLE
ncbi:hypothetical protein V6N13_010133 [Hibiscus sabdariffa]|uniref:CCHC-type domain-containing protein n=2 Tax=Hibiscus sabdariffa TaxID=183260 RepID=A0ABR2PQL6_9ROSI